MAAEEADAKSEIDKINDLATLEKISQTSNIPLLQRFALEKLNEMKKTSVMTNEVAHPIQEPPPEPNGKPSTNKTFLWVSLVALLAIIGGAAMWQRKK